MGSERSIWFGTSAPANDDVACRWRITDDAVRTRAYFISLENGGRRPDRDWLQAEREFKAEAGRLQAGNRWNAKASRSSVY